MEFVFDEEENIDRKAENVACLNFICFCTTRFQKGFFIRSLKLN